MAPQPITRGILRVITCMISNKYQRKTDYIKGDLTCPLTKNNLDVTWHAIGYLFPYFPPDYSVV